MNVIASTIKGFFRSRFNVCLFIALIAIGVIAFAFTGETQTAQSQGELEIHFFYLPTCPHCAEQKPIIQELQAEMTDISFHSHDASSQEGSALLYKMATEAGLDTSRLAVPTTFIGKHPLVGVHTKEQIIDTIQECIQNCKHGEEMNVTSQEMETSFTDYELPFIGRVDLTAYSLPALAIILGLIDGFNPCAMWVLVYLIGLLVGVNDRKKIWIIVGSFVLASGVLYFIFMSAWINIFLLVGYNRLLTMAIGLVALGGGILGLKDYMTTKGELACKVVDEKGHEKTIKNMERIVSEPLSIAIIFSIIGLAFVVNSVEFVCSSAIPAVFTQILAISGLSAFQHYAFIGLYVLFFMLDDILIFGMAAFAIGSGIGQKYAKHSKLIGGIILSILGIIMVFAPHLLR